MPRMLKDVKVKLVSILTDNVKPSNEEQAIIKSTDGFQRNIEVERVEIKKAEDTGEIQGLLYCNVMKANSVDTQGDIYDNETVRKAQEDFLDYLIEKGENKPSDTNHNYNIADGVKATQIWTDDSKEDWVFKMVLDISGNETLMEKAKDGKITGVSIAGYAKPEPEKQEKGIVKSILDGVKNIFKGTKDEYKKTVISGNIWSALISFYNTIVKEDYDETKGYIETISVSQEEYLKEVDELANILKSIKIENITKGEDMKKELEEFLKSEDGVKELEEMGFVKKETPEEEQKKPEEPNPLEELEKQNKVLLEKFQSEVAELKKEIEILSKQRKSDPDSLPEVMDINKMTNEELEELRKSKPEEYKALLEKEIERRKKK